MQILVPSIPFKLLTHTIKNIPDGMRERLEVVQSLSESQAKYALAYLIISYFHWESNLVDILVNAPIDMMGKYCAEGHAIACQLALDPACCEKCYKKLKEIVDEVEAKR